MLDGLSLPLIGICIAAAVGGFFLFRGDERVEDRRRQAFKLATDAKAQGLDALVPFLEDYAVGDYSSLIHRLRILAHDVRDDEGRKQLFEKFFRTQLADRAKTPEGRAQLLNFAKGLREGDSAMFGLLLEQLKTLQPAAPAAAAPSAPAATP